MCNTVEYRGRIYNSPAELAELLGGADRLVWLPVQNLSHPPRQEWRAMDSCLCHVDLETTLSKAGLKSTRGNDPMQWFVVED